MPDSENKMRSAGIVRSAQEPRAVLRTGRRRAYLRPKEAPPQRPTGRAAPGDLIRLISTVIAGAFVACGVAVIAIQVQATPEGAHRVAEKATEDAIWFGAFMASAGMSLLFPWMKSKSAMGRWLSIWGCLAAMLLGGVLWGLLDPR